MSGQGCPCDDSKDEKHRNRMNTITFTKQQARRFLLAHQGIWPTRRFEGISGVLAYIRHVGCIQFDPLNIVGHNHELVLQARIADFQPAMLQRLLYADRALLDGWDKNMSIYCVEDWPYFARRREAARRHHRHRAAPIAAILADVRAEIDTRGPLSSRDLTFDQIVDWAWAPTRLGRAALESMYFWGELIIHHKIHTRRVYDFARRHIAPEILAAPDPNETDAQFHDWCVLRRLGGIGLIWNKSGDAWLGMADIKSKERQAALNRLMAQGKVFDAAVDGVSAPLYMRSQDAAFLDSAMNGDDVAPRAVILAPLDNLLWERRLIEELFDFRYRWEVYKPAAERSFGYYALPVLYGDRFVARFEPGRDKKAGAIIIKQWWWEADVQQTDALREALRDCFQRFLRFHGAAALTIDQKAAQHAKIDWLTA